MYIKLISILLLIFIKETYQQDCNMNSNSNQDSVTSQNTCIKSCQLMNEFGIFVQISLVFTGLITLFYKRSKESPKRPLLIWMLDVSKQFIGAGMIHFINIGISYSASQPTKGLLPMTTNLCVWYFLNVAIDTTLGVFILWCWFTLLSIALEKLHIVIVKDECDTKINWYLWLQQLLVFLLAEILAKFCLYEFLINSPWLIWLGELCIAWTNDNEQFQVLFVMLIFPLIMNAIQFWLTDTIVKEGNIENSGHNSNNNNKSDFKYMHHHLIAIESKNQPIPTMITIYIDEQTESTPLLSLSQKSRFS